MHLHTDQLLSLARGRGEGTAAERQHVAGCPACAGELERLQGVRARLQALPEIAPPADAWQRITAVADARVATPTRRPYALAAGIAAAVVAVTAAVQIPLRDAADVAGAAPVTVSPAAVDDHAGWQLVAAENARLEALLAALPEAGHVRARTAYTVTALEDRLAYVDDQLSTAAFEPLAPGQAEQLWRERLYLMNSLVKVRYAQATAGL